eukprot:364028-Chlamydomonas_euryale.AAC.9
MKNGHTHTAHTHTMLSHAHNSRCPVCSRCRTCVDGATAAAPTWTASRRTRGGCRSKAALTRSTTTGCSQRCRTARRSGSTCLGAT